MACCRVGCGFCSGLRYGIYYYGIYSGICCRLAEHDLCDLWNMTDAIEYAMGYVMEYFTVLWNLLWNMLCGMLYYYGKNDVRAHESAAFDGIWIRPPRTYAFGSKLMDARGNVWIYD